MCTTANINLNGKFIFGRTLDLECAFGDGVVLVPRNFPIKLRSGKIILRHTAFLGMAAIRDGFPLFADGMNEYGLCIAGLNFPDSDEYAKHTSRNKTNLAPFEIIPYLLSMAKSADEAAGLIKDAHIVSIPFSDTIENTPLHYHVSDGVCGFIIEWTDGALHVYEDKVGVLTNSPPYPYQLYNLAHYLNIGREEAQNSHGARVFGKGLMAHGLPGDYSPTSRFAKAAWLCQTKNAPDGCELAVAESFMRAVAPPYGSIITENGKMHFTRYISLMQPSDSSYNVIFPKNGCESVKAKKESLDLDSLKILCKRTTSF